MDSILRRIMSLLLMVVLLIGAASLGTAAQAATLNIELVNQSDLRVVVTGAELNDYDSGDVLRLYVTVENRTGRKIDLFVREAYLDGTEVEGYGVYDVASGATVDDFLMFKALEDQSDAPLHDPVRYMFNLVVKDEDFNLLYTVPVMLEGPFPMGTDAPTVQNTPRPVIQATAMPEYVFIPLEFFEEGYIQWQDLKDDWFKVRVQVRNCDACLTVKAFEIYMYATDVYGERIYGDDWIYYETTKKNVGPGEVVYSEYFTVPCRSEVDRVYFGINRIVYSDGTVVNASDIEYWYWTMD